MNCKHQDKKRLYRREKTKWVSTNYYECDDCEAVLEKIDKEVELE